MTLIWLIIFFKLPLVSIIRRGVNVLKRIRHVLLEEISIREKLKVSVLGGRIWISFHFIRIKIYPVGGSQYERTQHFLIKIFRLKSV